MTLFSQSGGERNVSERESQLVQRAANGDLESFDRLAKRYQSAVYGLAYHWTCNFADAEDIVQEALVQGFERLAQLRDPGRFPGWLRMIALNICRKRHRGEQYREVSMDAPAHAEIRDRLADPRPLPDQTIEARQAIEILDVLSEPVRLTVTLFYIDDLTHKEISQFLDVREVSGYLHLQEQGDGCLRPIVEAEASPDDVFVSRKYIWNFDLEQGDFIEGQLYSTPGNKAGRGVLGLDQVNGESVDSAHRCSFCGRRKDEVVQLVKGPAVNICNACVEACIGVLAEKGYSIGSAQKS